LVAPSAIGPLAGSLIARQTPAIASAAIRAATTASLLLVHVSAFLARCAVRLAAGQPAAESFSAASVSLVDGVLATMILKKLTVIASVIVTLGIGSGREALFVAGSRAQDAPAAAADIKTQPEIDPLLNELIQAARQRLLAQKDYYGAGRITIDRYIAASSDLARVELLAAKSEVQRGAIRRRHVQFAKEVEAHEKAERDSGRSTESDFAEAHQGRVQAEFNMKAGEKEEAEKTSLLRRLAELERRVEQLQKSEAGRAAPRAR
jgi:hypothetical protein